MEVYTIGFTQTRAAEFFGKLKVVVLPTGGGKSLCFQAPAMCLDGVAVVVSPPIALMKDQVDGLRNCGVPAAFANSTLSAAERRRVAEDVRAGRVRLLYLAPERLLTEGTLEFLKTVRISLVAIDEVHCISSWGHDFRPQYRGLGVLKDAFPNAGIHAYTATASEKVRQDIAQQLRLRDPEILVGLFDRPNLIYKVQRRADRLKQICEVLDRHPGESGIIYTIARRDVDQTTAALAELGYRLRPYHVGMTDDERRRRLVGRCRPGPVRRIEAVASRDGCGPERAGLTLRATARIDCPRYNITRPPRKADWRDGINAA